MPEAMFIQGRRGDLFAVLHRPMSNLPYRGSILYVHPFGEELNRSRRVVANQAQVLAAHGYAILLLDLYGCGDSDGDTQDCAWGGWLDDVCSGARLLSDWFGGTFVLWGLRLGALLSVAAVADGRVQPDGLLLWQPVVRGALYMRQLLLMEVVRQRRLGLSCSEEDLLNELSAGRSIETVGGLITARLKRDMACAALQKLTPPTSQIGWIDITARATIRSPSDTKLTLRKWQESGIVVNYQQVPGEAFWSTYRVDRQPVLERATLKALIDRPEP